MRREGRLIPFSGIVAADAAAAGSSVPSSQSLGPDDPATPFRWAQDPTDWPESALLAAEARSVIAAAIEELPDSQRVVISLRDVDGWTSAEVCEALDISDGNQRVLLHRARSSLRAVLDGYVNGAAR
jgi:RNA polymerase sigma-70 factor (ECF subfamily)